LLVANRHFEKVAEFLRPEHFFDPVHGRIFEAMRALVERGQIADPVTLKGYFRDDADLAKVGGARYLVDLAAAMVSVIDPADYGRIIHDLYLRRSLIEIGEDMVNEAYRHELDSDARGQIEVTEKRLYDLATTGDVDGGFIKLHDPLVSAITMAEQAFQNESRVVGVTTGLVDLDRKLGGLQKSDLLILAGRPSMGKTALATNIGFNAARAFARSGGKEGAVVGFFSLEMSAEQLATRILADEVRIPSNNIRRGEVKDSDFPKFIEAAHELGRLPFFIDDTPGLTVGTLRARARRLKRAHNLGMLVIDYLQLLRGSARQSENRVQEISEITRSLKVVAKELEIPVVALSQLSRAVEARDEKRPQLSDLRESGSIEQDADVVMFVFREQYYLERAEPSQKPEEAEDKFHQRHDKWKQRCEEAHNMAEVIIAKQRHGPIGTVELQFDGQFTRFSDLENRYANGR